MILTEALLGEHAVFYAQFDHLVQTVPSVGDLKIIQAQTALIASALATHAQLEEDLLFKALDPHLGEMGPLAVMRMEHQEIESTLEQILNLEDLVEAKQKLLHVVHLAREHFAKEEQVLYPMASKILGSEQLTMLGEQWAERRSVSVH